MYKKTFNESVIRLSDGHNIAQDPLSVDWQCYTAWLAEGNTPLPADAETPEQAFTRLQSVVQRRLDDWAMERGYESILSLCTYATSTVPKFKIEGQRGVEVRDAHWNFGYSLLAQVEAGRAPIPTEDELLQMLPPMDWQE